MENYHQLVNKKITGEINHLEEIEFQNWLRKSPENELFFRRIMDAWQQGQYTIKIKGQQATFNRLSRQIDFEEKIFSHDTYNQRSNYWRKWHSVAAVFIFLVAMASMFYFNTSTSIIEQEIIQSELIWKNNPAGQKTKIHLPDGSVCFLNSESEIKFPSNFSDSTREVFLIGEAYFEVAKDKDRPFRVHASTMTVTALGTVFNVNSFANENKETVALIEGKISVACADNFYHEVLPGEAVSFDKDLKTSIRVNIDPKEAKAWKNGILILNEATYQTIFTKLERWYGVKIGVIGNLPVNRQYKGRFKNELLVNILESISYGHEFDFKIDGKNVNIMFN